MKNKEENLGTSDNKNSIVPCDAPVNSSNSVEQEENEPFWQGQMYAESKQRMEVEKLFDDNGLRLELTCAACPEQYDVYKRVGYIRLRHGELRVDFPDCGEETIYEAEPKGDGIFLITERIKYMTEAMNAILKKLNSEHKNSNNEKGG